MNYLISTLRISPWRRYYSLSVNRQGNWGSEKGNCSKTLQWDRDFYLVNKTYFFFLPPMYLVKFYFSFAHAVRCDYVNGFWPIGCIWKWPHKTLTWSSALSSSVWQLSAEDPTEDSEALGDGETTRWKETGFLSDHMESTSWPEISTLDFVWARSQLLLCQDAEMWDFVIAAGVIHPASFTQTAIFMS